MFLFLPVGGNKSANRNMLATLYGSVCIVYAIISSFKSKHVPEFRTKEWEMDSYP